MLAFSLAFICMTTLLAQLPRTNVYLFEILRTDTTVRLASPKFLTFFNENGYNNQPEFFDDDELYLTVKLAFENQTDLYRLNLTEGTKTKITATQEGEYSPKLMPDKYHFSAVRQEIIGADTVQRLWQFPLDRVTNGKPVFKYINKVGYYHWISGTQVAVFMVDSPNYLAIADTRTDDIIPVATNPGRCFKTLPNGNLAFVQKSNDGKWMLMEKNMYRSNMSATSIVETLEGSEDFAVLPNGTFLMGKGSKLYKFNRFHDKEWVEVADLRFYKITDITRIAISQDMKLAIVAD